jgi:hypothetical protein
MSGNDRGIWGDFFGSDGFHAAWLSFPPAIAATSSAATSFSIVRLRFGRRDCSTWHGGGLEGVERSVFRIPSEGTCDQSVAWPGLELVSSLKME